jgi:hypothetical protein
MHVTGLLSPISDKKGRSVSAAKVARKPRPARVRRNIDFAQFVMLFCSVVFVRLQMKKFKELGRSKTPLVKIRNGGYLLDSGSPNM